MTGQTRHRQGGVSNIAEMRPTRGYQQQALVFDAKSEGSLFLSPSPKNSPLSENTPKTPEAKRVPPSRDYHSFLAKTKNLICGYLWLFVAICGYKKAFRFMRK